jgi:hypothetical protein
MKKTQIITFLLAITSLINAQQEQTIEIAFPILNQYTNIRDINLATDGSEAYFTIQSPAGELSQIAFIKKTKNNWSKPQLLPCSDQYNYLEPFLSIDQKRLYFASDRPLNNSSSEKKDFDIWYLERQNKNQPWSQPINLGTPINTNQNEFYPTLADNNNLYFTLDSPSGLGKDDIYYAKWNGTNYENPELLNQNINTAGYEFNAFISNNEDFLIYTKYNTPDGFGSGDLYIARKDNQGQWQTPTNLGKNINTKYMEYCPFYDQANQTLYFTSKRNNIAPKQFKNLKEYQQYILQSHNGLSKIYKTKINLTE